jgi:hypothetical protein
MRLINGDEESINLRSGDYVKSAEESLNCLFLARSICPFEYVARLEIYLKLS